jgi:putative DNA primase/helicase
MSAKCQQARGEKVAPFSWIFHCPCHDDRKPSCSLRKEDGLLTCFRPCDRADVGRALDALGFPDDRKQPAPVDSAVLAWRKAEGIKAAQWEWEHLQRDDEQVRLYLLRHRRITLLTIPACLKPVGNGLAACLQELDGTITAVHTKLPGRKGTVGSGHYLTGHGAIQLATPTDGKLGLAEGVETALAATELTGVPCWATLGSWRMHRIHIPAGVREIVIFADNDKAGREAADEAWHSYPEYDVSVWPPPEPHNDWNDYLKEIRKGRDER